MTWVNGFQQADAPVFHALDKVLAHTAQRRQRRVARLTVALLIAGFGMARRASRSVLDDVIAEPVAAADHMRRPSRRYPARRPRRQAIANAWWVLSWAKRPRPTEVVTDGNVDAHWSVRVERGVACS